MNHDALRIGVETPTDVAAVRAVNQAAFETPAEARLVDALREQSPEVISLVAVVDGELVGHICFSPVTLTGYPQLKLAGLAPMAVLPRYQRQGIGTALVREGLERCRREGYDAVVVLGHPEFYPRFGFGPANRWNIRCEYDAPAEAFMLAELRPGSLRGVAGTIQYHAAFSEL